MSVVPFITFDPVQNCYAIPDATKHLLESIEGPLAVVVICGMYRSGKSTLLNKCLLDCKPGEGFDVGNSITACTKGIWLHLVPTPDKQLLILDAEGAFSLSANRNHDTKIFVLALLLSSYFIYNSVKSIDSSALQNLSLVTNLSKFIQTKRGSDSNALVHVLPSLLWIIRDFSLQLVDQDGQLLTPNQYLEQALNPSPGADEDTLAVQEVMRNAFVTKECRTLLRPCNNEEDLQNLDQLDTSALRPEFLKEMVDLRTHIFQAAPLKKIGAVGAEKLLSGAMLYQLAAEYVSVFNKGECPVIEDSWKVVGQQQTSQLIQKLESQYKVDLHSLPVTNLENLQLIATQSQQSFMVQFRENAMFPQSVDILATGLQKITDDVTALHQQQIITRIHSRLTEFQRAVTQVKDFAELKRLVLTTHSQLEEVYGEQGTSLFQQCWLVTQWDTWSRFNQNIAAVVLELQNQATINAQALDLKQIHIEQGLTTIKALEKNLEKLRAQEQKNHQEVTMSMEQLLQLHLQEKNDWVLREAVVLTNADKACQEARQSLLTVQQQYQDNQLELEKAKQEYSELTTSYTNLSTNAQSWKTVLVSHQQLELEHQQLKDAHQLLQSRWTEYQNTDENELNVVQAELVQWRQHTVSVLDQLKNQHETELSNLQKQTSQLVKTHQEDVRQRTELQNELKNTKDLLDKSTELLQSEHHNFGQQLRLTEIKHREEMQQRQKEFDLAKDLHLKERNELQLLLHTTETNAACTRACFNANKRKLEEYENSATELKLREAHEKLLSTVSSLQTKSEWLERLYKQTQSELIQSSSTVSKLQQQYHTLQRQHEIELLRLTLTHEMVAK